ncbi:MAG: hypothetical protein LBH21_07770 [Gracilibacteraceae bacterium]|jgi:hypothetical protein|nr:hypothetical protein [Gracilibacteraceae bacterium]
MNKIKDAFDAIRADDSLKAGALEYILNESRKRESGKPFFARRNKMRFAFASAACALLLFLGLSSHYAYFSATAFLDIDINPSVELAVNRFGRVIEASAYNGEGAGIITETGLTHKSYREAMRLIVDAAVARGYLRDEAVLAVTVQTGDTNRENAMLADVESNLAAAAAKHHIEPRTEVFPISADARNEARGQDVSPAKYLAILELQKVDPTASVDSCRDHSIGEIRELTQSHGNSRHSSDNAGGEDAAAPNNQNRNGHHNGSGHHNGNN